MAAKAERAEGTLSSSSKTTPRCNVRLFRPGDEQAVVELLQAAYSRWPNVDTDVTALDYLRWKMSAPRQASIVLGEQDGTVAAMSMRTLRPVRAGGTELTLQLGHDSCVLPGYRGTGVMSKVRSRFQDLLESRGDLLIFLSAHPAFDKIRVSEGVRPLGNPVQVLSCNEPYYGAAQKDTTPWTIEEQARFDGRVDDFWDEASSPFDFIIARQHGTLNWRYCDPRGGAFTIRAAEWAGRLLGYAVLRVTNGLGYIADLLALPGRTDVAQSLVVDALGFFRERRVPSVQTWCPALHPYRNVLTSLGFVNKTRTLHLGWVAFTDKPDLTVLSNKMLTLHLMPGDTDLV